MAKWQKYYLITWIISAIYLLSLEEQIEALFPVLSVHFILLVSLHVLVISLFKKKRNYFVFIIILNIVVQEILKFAVVENFLGKWALPLSEGLGLGELISILLGFGLF